MRNAFRILVRKSEGKKLLGMSRRRLESGIKTDLIEIGCVCVYEFIWLRVWTSDGLLWTR
jgi:hypothetical protein